MYIPVWGMCLLSAIGGALVTFIGAVLAVVVSERGKRKNRG